MGSSELLNHTKLVTVNPYETNIICLGLGALVFFYLFIIYWMELLLLINIGPAAALPKRLFFHTRVVCVHTCVRTLLY